MPRRKQTVLKEVDGTEIVAESKEVEAKAKKYKKEGPIEVTYQTLLVQRDGKNIIKVREVKKYDGFTDQQLAYQSTNGKQVAGFMSKEDLIKKGVKF